MIRPLFVLVLCSLPALANALSCGMPDIVGMYKGAVQSSGFFLPVHGQFDSGQLAALRTKVQDDYDANAAPFADYRNLRFTGTALTKQGFTRSFDKPITLRLTCIGGWCTRKPRPGPMLAFIEIKKGTYLLDLDACGGWAFMDPTAADLKKIEVCHRSGPCKDSFD